MINRYLFSALILSSFLINVPACALTNDAAIKIKWGYTGHKGPKSWGELDPSFATCSTGEAQSPINIIKDVTKTANTLSIHYQPAPMRIVDDGETSLMIAGIQTLIKDGHGIQLNFPLGQTKEFIEFNGNVYQLVQFHMHTPSETQWHNQSYPLEIHFVHQAEGGKVAVIAVLVKADKANAALQTIIDHLPTEEGEQQLVPDEQINPNDLLPAKHDYYNFVGSLTTPPCTEGIQWVVMANAISASPAQIMRLRKSMGNNARPPQPLNGRQIFYSG